MSYSALWPDHEFVDDAGKLRVSKLGANSMKRRIFLACAGVLATAMIISPQALAQKATVTARVGYIPIIGTAPFFVANGEGWLKQAGIDPTVTIFESGPNMIQALASGTIDIYVAGVAPLAVARSNGIDVRVVAATARRERVRRRRRSSPSTSRPARRRLRPSRPTAPPRARRHGLRPSRPARCRTPPCNIGSGRSAKADKADVEIVPMGIDATQQAMLAGAVEGATVREPARDHRQDAIPASSWSPSAKRCSPASPARSSPCPAPSSRRTRTPCRACDRTRAGRGSDAKPPTRLPASRGRARQGHRGPRNDPQGPGLAGEQVRDRPRIDRRAVARHAGLSGQAGLAREGTAVRRPVRATLLRARHQERLIVLMRLPCSRARPPRLSGVVGGVPRLGLVNSAFLPGPSAIPPALLKEVTRGAWLSAIDAASGIISRTGGGAGLGIALGVVTGMSRTAEGFTAWVVRVLRPIPGLAWVPFAIIWFGVNTPAAVFIIAIGVFWIVYFAAQGAIRGVDRDLVEVADAFGFRSPWQRLRRSCCRPRCPASWSACAPRSARPGWRWWRPRSSASPASASA